MERRSILQMTSCLLWKQFHRSEVSCLGACGLAPAVMVNDEVHPKMTPEKMSELIAKLREDEKV